MGGPRITSDQAVIIAASKLPQPFPVWDLVVETWKLWPERFGIPGYDHPNATRVLCTVMTHKSASTIGRGWIERVAENTYRLTAAGRAEAERVRGWTDLPELTKRPPSAAEVKVKELTAQVGRLRSILIKVRLAISAVRTSEEERQGLALLMHDIRAALGEKEYASG
jgi:hypothetical protein